MSSVGSNGPPENRHLKLVEYCAKGREDLVRQIVSEATWKSQIDLDSLRHGLQRVAARGNVSLIKFLLESGAEVDARKDTEVAAVFRAAENGHVAATKLLLGWKAEDGKNAARDRTAAKDRWGRTVIFPAAERGYIEVLKLLLAEGANVNAVDKKNRTVLLHLAAEKLFKWNEDIVLLLLSHGADVEVKDSDEKTSLIWAAATGKGKMVKLLLDHKANPNMGNHRGRTALHFAAEIGELEVVEILLQYNVNKQALSAGRWTALHNAANEGRTEIVAKLLIVGVDVNAQLEAGSTALHLAAKNGHKDIVLLLLQHDAEIALKDSSDRTPLLCAAENGNDEIIHLLAPERIGEGKGVRLPANKKLASELFKATIVDFGGEGKPQRKFTSSMYDLLYGWDEQNKKPRVATQMKNIKSKPNFRWIHIPANNLSWANDMIDKVFIESGHREVEDFKALAKCFNQEHRGRTVHATFMRTYAERIPPMTNHRNPMDRPPEIIQEEAIAQGAPTPAIQVSPATPMKGSLATLPEKENQTPKSGDEKQKKKTKAEKLAERHGKKALGSPVGNRSKQQEKIVQQPKTPKFAQSGKVLLFMPYLHYETHNSREKMSSAIKRSRTLNTDAPIKPEELLADDLLIQSYLKHGPRSAPGLHPRRTLDQFFYHNINTSQRDRDQVVWRYCQREGLEPRVFMVDQLWIWILSKDLIMTCFPQRWEQPPGDPLNVLDGIIHDSNSKTRDPVESVWDLAMLITGRCSGMFDRHRLDDPQYQFLDMFESSIGWVTNEETRLFNRFNRASELSGQWLKTQQRHRGRRLLMTSNLNAADDVSNNTAFVDALLNIDTEAKLLAEIKDIRDELNIIRRVLEDQAKILPDFVDCMIEENGGKRILPVNQDLRKKATDQVKVIGIHINDLKRMDKQAEQIYNSLMHVLDLKQKHANAVEARFTRDQAAFTARQGQTIMVFTIVTIVFLPMSFIASFFAINIRELPQSATSGQNSLPIAYVSKYMFGIGFGISLPLIFLALAVDDVFGAIAGLFHRIGHLISGKPPQSDDGADDEAVWIKRYTESRLSHTEKAPRYREYDRRTSRSSINRDLSPFSERSNLSYGDRGNGHIAFARYQRPRRGSVVS